MKNLLFLTLLCLGLMGGARGQTCTSTISSYPYYQNFEAGAGGWTSGGNNSSWALGQPNKLVINSAASGTKSWATNLSGNYNANEQSFVESPCFNTNSLTQPVVEMKIWWNSEFSWDGAVLQSSIDNGATWQIVGANGDPNNWYNDNSIGAGPGGQPAASAIGWTGRTGFTPGNGSGNWVVAKHALTGLGGKTSVKLRIAFGSGPTTEDEGFAFDDVSVYELPANDASVASITNPVVSIQPNVSTPITVTIKNHGSTALSTATLGFSVNGAVISNNFAFSGNLATNQVSAPVVIGNHTFPAGVYTIKAWTRLPNSVPDGNPGNDTISVQVYSCTSLSGTYTINKLIPASATNFQSFTAASLAMLNCGVSGPVTFNVVSGSGPYTEAVTFGNIPGASATNTITFNGNGNTILRPAASPADGVLKLSGTKFFRFNNLQVETDPATVNWAVLKLENAAANNIFSGCTFTHSITTTSAASQAVLIMQGCTSNNFQDNTIIGGYYGILNNGSSPLPNNNNQFSDNIFKDQNFYAFSSSNANNIIVSGNDISRSLRTNGTSFYGINFGPGSLGIMISKNRIHNTHDAATATNGTVYGIYMSAPGTLGAENIIKNNIIYNINCGGGTLYAFYNSNANNTYYYNNTVSADNQGVNYNILRGIHFTTSTANVQFINNNLSLSSTATTKHAIYLSNQTNSLYTNNNNFYLGTSGNVAYYLGANVITLTAWKIANSNTYDQASVSADPLFVNVPTGNLKPTNPILNNIGQVLTAVTDDITGTPRNATTPDPGAYEFTPAANDAGISAILSPVSPATPSVSLPVTVTLSNYGLSPLTSVTINWSINSIAQSPFTWTGHLTTSQSANVTIGNYTFAGGIFALNICTSLPNGVADPNAINDCRSMSVISCNALAGTYTINKNVPASASNFVSFTTAVNTLVSCGITAPVTINVVAGSGPYNEVFEIFNINGTSATNTVTFNGNGNTLSSPSPAADAVVKLNGAKHILFNNLNIEVHANVSGGSVVSLVNNAQNNTFSGCTITHSKTITATSYAVSLLTGSSNNTFQNNTLIGAYYGIYNGGAFAVLNSGNQFIGNTLKDMYNAGIYNYFGPNTLIEGNDISRPTRTNGILFHGIYNATAGSTAVIISRNRIHNTNDAATATAVNVYGIYTSAPGAVGSENIVKNNAIYNLNNTGGMVYGLYNSNSGNTYYYNNTVAVDTASGSYNAVYGMYFTAASQNVKFVNNLVSLTSTATTKYALYLATNGIMLISDYNDLFAPGGHVGYLVNAFTTLANWKTVNTAAYDQNSVSLDPLFVNVALGNLYPTEPNLNNLAQPLTAVTDDITGALRSVTMPDIGAFEFNINVNDVGVIAVSGPVATGCGLTNAETITITLKNFGNVAHTSIPVSYTINGNGTVNETFTGSLAPGATAPYAFTAKADLSVPSTFEIIARTNLIGDANASNNADTLNITNSLITGMPVTLNFETVATGITRFRKVVNPKSNIAEDVAASFGATSTKGLIMDGVNHAGWVMPSGLTDPWTTNPDNFAGAYICFDSTGAAANDTLLLTFDLKQLYKAANANTNFRVTVNGTQVGPTYLPPFSGTPINWQKIRVDLSQYKNDPFVMIGLESSVKEAYDSGNGTANLIDNIEIKRVAGPTAPTGLNEHTLQSNVQIYPNPSNGQFKVALTKGKNYSFTVSDLSGKVIRTQTTRKEDNMLDMTGVAKGIYLLKIQSATESVVRKLVIE
ncbi:T9SS type A sorting domain-containing protein [Adhaeribacter sp. BT258]|uniref:T9SS type A sorting domain-containing protein n=1 Tax=Adhaeribacter terrigena TaxID=2793070 RepID=A0ABS1BXX9_9BACT|nr:T9SS type A sorting domain-containing protein [Adhaeribacter terrigena]MBK0401888.1 T9SS type A sorting domain-containing protein [Adhaeribacter terrigena]